MNSKLIFNPLVSIIIPAYNVERYIEHCIVSILKQSYTNIEILVVNDGSSDNTPNIVHKLALVDCRIKLIDQKNSGVSAARNAGIRASKGEYIVFVDGDDYLAVDYVEYMLKLIKATKGELCLSLNCFTKAGERQIKHETIEVLDPIKATALLLSPRIKVGCWNKIYKRSVLVEHSLEFLTTLFYGEGLCFFTTYAQYCKIIGVGNRKVYYYRKNNDESATTKFNINSLTNGYLALGEIEKRSVLKSSLITNALGLHKCLFCMGAVVRIKKSGKKDIYSTEYKMFKSILHEYTPKYIFKGDISLYYKGLLVGTCLSPILMAWLDSLRCKYIASVSV